MILKDLLEYALTRFYPKNRQKLNNIVYPSKVEMYDEWFNNVYVNGSWYIGVEDEDIGLSSSQRSLIKVFLLYTNENIEYKYGVGVIVNGFLKNHNMSCIINNDDDYTFNLTDFTKINNTTDYRLAGGLFYEDNISLIRLKADEVISDYVKYNSIPVSDYYCYDWEDENLNLTFNKMEYTRFTRDYYDIVKDIDVKFKVSGNQLFVKQDNNVLTVKSLTLRIGDDNQEELTNPVDNMFSCNINYQYCDCILEYVNGLKLIFKLKIRDMDWMDLTDYIIDY